MGTFLEFFFWSCLQVFFYLNKESPEWSVFMWGRQIDSLGWNALCSRAHPLMGQLPAQWGWLGLCWRIRELLRALSGLAVPPCQANLISVESLACNMGCTVLLPAEMLPWGCLLLVCPTASAKLRKAEKMQCFILYLFLLSASNLRL